MIGNNFGNEQYFNPRWLPGLDLWITAKDPNANGTLPSTGSSLSSWVDKSPQGNNASQSTGANQPVFNTNQINGHPAITFSASHFMTTGTNGFSTGSNARTFFCVYQPITIATDGYIFLYGTNVTDEYWAPIIIGSQLWIDINTHNANSTTTTLANGTNYIFEYNYPGSGQVQTTTMTVNGISQTVNPNSPGTPNTVIGSSVISGFPPGGSLGVIGKLGEIVMCNGSLSAVNTQLLRRYMANEWGISV